jgi:bifunctional UDP-N-acetylglucosamine pyrophosphorylase / glucosamine-1-phosphate N-acetyltransferase
MNLHVVILAAGQGKRMHSKCPKVLHSFAGVPILERILQTVHLLKPEGIHVVYGHGGNLIPKTLSHYDVHWYHQDQQLGTAHALAQALPHIANEAKVLVLVGDAPLITLASLTQLVTTTPKHQFGLITAKYKNPFGMGRIIRNNEQEIVGIVEEKDASIDQKLINEVSTGILLGTALEFKALLPTLTNHNAQGEYYLTDIINITGKNGQVIHNFAVEEPEETMGINNRQQLEHLERYYQKKTAQTLMEKGVSIADTSRFDLRGTLEVGKDVSIDVDVIFEGNVIIGSDCKIGPFSVLKNVVIGDHVEIKSHCVIEDSVIADHCTVGPFARFRPGTQLLEGAHVGNFVEVKNSEIGPRSKVGHLSYIGDTTIGSETNIGAGTITCNYDGANKHRTIIEDNVFIGSDTQLVAPVTIGKGATIGAGSTITQNTPPEALTLSRSKQVSIPHWQRATKKTKEN